MKINQKKNSKNKINKKLKKNYEYESKTKIISQNSLLSSNNKTKIKDNYLYLNKYTKPFNGNNNIIKKENKKLSTEKDNNISNNQEIKNKNKENIFNDEKKENKKNLKKYRNNGYSQETRRKPSDKYNSKEEEELTTSFEKKPSEIQSPKTISEDSFITEFSNYSHNKNKNLNYEKDENKNGNNDEDIVNYDKKEYFQNLEKDYDNQKYNKKEKEEILEFNISKKYNKNKINDYKINSCKKIASERFYEEKLINNIELKDNSQLLINEYSNKKNKSQTKNKNEYNIKKNNDSIDINFNKEKINTEDIFLNNTITKKRNNLNNEINFDKKNSINNSNIYIPVNQRKKLESNKKNKNNSKEPIFESTKYLNKKNIFFNSIEISTTSKLLTKRLDLIQKNKNNKNYSIEEKFNNENFEKNIEIMTFNEKEKSTNNNISNNNNYNNISNKKSLKFNKNKIIKKKSYIRKNNFEKNSFLDKKYDDKFKITNNIFFKNKNINKNANKKNLKLFLSIDNLNGNQKSKKNCDLSKISTIKSPIIYEPKKPSMKSKLLYNRASYDPNNSKYNLIRKKKLLKQSLTTIDLLNDKQNSEINLNNILEKHTRNYSGINNNSEIFNKNKKISEFNPNKLKNLIKNNYIFNHNNSHSIDRNTINMKIINSLSRSYDSNFCPKLNNYTKKNSNNIFNDKEIDLQILLQNKNIINNNINNNNKTPNKNIIKNNSYFNNTMRENDKRKLNIYANNINNINNYLDINNPILKYNNRTNKENNLNQNNNINIINTNNNKNYINKERLTFFPQQRNLSLELDNQYNKFNNLNIHNYQNQPNLINLNNNNNNIFDQNLNNNNNYFGFNLNLLNYLNQQKINNLSISINIEDLILLLEKFNNIILNFNNNKRIVYNECFEFWNYYYNCSVYCQLEKLYTNHLDSNTIRISINYCLISIMILYDYSFEINTLKNDFIVINNILKLNYMNLMLIAEHTLKIITSSKIQLNNNNNNNLFNNFLIVKLYNIIDMFRKRGGFQNDFIEMKPFPVVNDLDMSNIEKISYNTNLIIQYLRYILKNYKTSKNEIITSFFKKIKEKTYEEINIFFREQIFRIINQNGSILASVLLNNLKINNMNSNLINKYNFRTLPAPYLRTKNNKKYSLVLDLDETLIHFKPGSTDEEGVVRIRPGITEFLEEIGKFYELIIFTTATQEYADLLIDAIEEDKIYFDHRLYREHAIIIDNDFVKDLTRIGRPLDKIIIIDDMPQNFKLQKENGIIIRPFWGEDNCDMALYNLIPILKSIAMEGKDVRIGLAKYKDEIFKNITSDLYV